MLYLLFLIALVAQVAAQQTDEDTVMDVLEGEACPKGSWSADGTMNIEDGEECEICEAGTAAGSEGSLSCDECEKGFYSAGEGMWECTACPKGQINNKAGEVQCFPCAPGSYNPAEGQEVCLNCAEGYYQDGRGAEGCKECPAGFVNDQKAQEVCSACAPGTVQSLTGQFSCVDCQAGTFSAPDSDHVTCADAPAGFFVAVAKAAAATPCPAGQSSLAGATDCFNCAAGSFNAVEGSLCTKCPVATYNPDTGATACQDCPSNTDVQGATVCTVACPDGEVLVGDVCTPCAAGQYASNGACEVCAAGTYSAASSTACTTCAVGTYSPIEGADKCQDCPGNTDPAGDFTVCKIVCDAGEVVKDGACVPCAAGSYEKEGVCELCAAGTFNGAEGATVCAGCAAGAYSPEGATACLACAAGTAQSLTGQASCDACSAGFYADVTGSIACLECASGEFQAATGQAVCDKCSPGTFNDQIAQTACADCSAGSYSAAGGAIECAKCEAGSFSAATAAQECDLCPSGTYTESVGTTSCVLSPAGYYSGEGTVTPTICPVGSFCPEGSAAPVDCPEGTGTQHEASKTVDECVVSDCKPGFFKDNGVCHICPKGQFSNIVNAVACRKCPVHQYNAAEGAVQCMNCPDTAYTWGEESTSLDDCVGPRIEVCSEPDFAGTCHIFYDDSLDITKYHPASLRILKGEFDLYTQTNKRGAVQTVVEGFSSGNLDLEISAFGSFSVVLNNVFCALDKGWEFRGSARSTSASGKACINWKKTPMASKAKPNHFCQNPDGVNLAAKPYCYVSETETEECDIPSCVWDMDCYTGVGRYYRGKVSTTHIEKNCQGWNKDFPHPHGYHSPKYNWAGIGTHNHCRNPDKSGKPWCYTTNLFYRWDYCDIQQCTREEFDFYRF